jgi:hypothetical protein
MGNSTAALAAAGFSHTGQASESLEYSEMLLRYSVVLYTCQLNKT